MSETPRVDAAQQDMESSGNDIHYRHHQYLDLARQLERELGEMSARLQASNFSLQLASAFSDESKERAEKAERSLAQAQARCAELEKDAARYRWLRDRVSIKPADSWSGAKKLELMEIFEQPNGNFGGELSAGEHLDAAIKAALKEPR